MEPEQPTTGSVPVAEVNVDSVVPTTTTAEIVDSEPMEKGDILKLALNHLVQGKRHLLVKDISSAIVSLGESCQLLSEVNGPLSADNAEAHFYYGKALLEQSRLDLSVFDGGAAPEKEGDSDEDSEEEEEEEDDQAVKDDEKEESSSDAVEKMETTENDAESGSLADGKEQTEEDLSTPSPLGPGSSAAAGSSSVMLQDNEQPSTSSGIGEANGGADKEGEEELSNCELAFQVLEIAKIGYNAQLKLALGQLEKVGDDVEVEKSKTKTKLHLQKRLSETHSLLGEVATELENYQLAVEDFKTAMKILSEIEGEDSREVAQLYFQVGLAYSFAKEFDLAIESFEKSKTIIELRILNLQAKIDNKQTVKDLGGVLEDVNYSEEAEILELKSLLPELDEKVADTIDAERESKATVAEAIQEQEIALKNSPVKNPNPPAVNDISHLVKKKKKADEESLDVPPSKRACTDSNNTVTTISNSKTDEVTSTNGHSSHENGHKNGSPMKPSEV